MSLFLCRNLFLAVSSRTFQYQLSLFPFSLLLFGVAIPFVGLFFTASSSSLHVVLICYHFFALSLLPSCICHHSFVSISKCQFPLPFYAFPFAFFPCNSFFHRLLFVPISFRSFSFYSFSVALSFLFSIRGRFVIAIHSLPFLRSPMFGSVPQLLGMIVVLSFFRPCRFFPVSSKQINHQPSFVLSIYGAPFNKVHLFSAVGYLVFWQFIPDKWV